MGRKRQEGITTASRFRLKMFRVFSAGVPESLALEAANAVAEARAKGVGIYKTSRDEARAVLMRREVPSALWGVYFAFTNELVNKVQRKKEATRDQIIAKWVANGADASVLNEIADEIGVDVKTTETKPATKG
jgi:hypothetical protein